MCSKLIDTDTILSSNLEWSQLEKEWGNPVDLDTEDDPPMMSPVLSTLDLRKSTFDSSFIHKKVKRKLGRQFSQKSVGSNIGYQEFIEDLEDESTKDLPLKQFYFISGQILSALSVEEICDKIDDIFQSVERLCSATSTIRKKRPVLPERVQCSMSGDLEDLSFDDTVDEKEKSDSDDIDRYIDEAFDQLNATINTINNMTTEDLDQSTRETVTTLVRKFSRILKSPRVNRSPRRHRECNERFRDLAEFWKSKIQEN